MSVPEHPEKQQILQLATRVRREVDGYITAHPADCIVETDDSIYGDLRSFRRVLVRDMAGLVMQLDRNIITRGEVRKSATYTLTDLSLDEENLRYQANAAKYPNAPLLQHRSLSLTSWRPHEVSVSGIEPSNGLFGRRYKPFARDHYANSADIDLFYERIQSADVIEGDEAQEYLDQRDAADTHSLTQEYGHYFAQPRFAKLRRILRIIET